MTLHVSVGRQIIAAEQYDRALHAHEHEDLVEVTGTIVREGRYAWIYSPESFAVLGGGLSGETPSLFEGLPGELGESDIEAVEIESGLDNPTPALNQDQTDSD